MKKVILFLWFGDEKPPYIQWTLENFRKMNPGWEIRYIEYSNEQILNYKEQKDPILSKSMDGLIDVYNHELTSLSDTYRLNYLNEHKDELVVYCDLDCFPIAPFDNFIFKQSSSIPDWVGKGFCNQTHRIKALGCCCEMFSGFNIFKDDLWCIGNNNLITFNQFFQLHKGSLLDDTLIFHMGMLINKKNIPIYWKRSKAFHEMKISLGDNFCLTQFTPIEHYYSWERNTLNRGFNSKQ